MLLSTSGAVFWGVWGGGEGGGERGGSHLENGMGGRVQSSTRARDRRDEGGGRLGGRDYGCSLGGA
jgi:hypothetical protein